MFDRVLVRVWRRWLVHREEFVRGFWREFGEEEFGGDVTRLGECFFGFVWDRFGLWFWFRGVSFFWEGWGGVRWWLEFRGGG